MKIINLILFSFCVLFQGCKNEPKEQLENKMYLISDISNDSILVFGKNNIDDYILRLYDIKSIFEITDSKISKTEKLIKKDLLKFCKIKNMYLYNELKKVDFRQLRRQYLFYEDSNNCRKLLISFWNPNYNSASKEFFENTYFKGFANKTHTFEHVCIFTITINFDKMEILDIRHW
jgi:hypothetical protein